MKQLLEVIITVAGIQENIDEPGQFYVVTTTARAEVHGDFLEVEEALKGGLEKCEVASFEDFRGL